MQRWTNGFKTALLLGLMGGLILAAARSSADAGTSAIALLVALAVNGYAYLNSDKLALRACGPSRSPRPRRRCTRSSASWPPRPGSPCPGSSSAPPTSPTRAFAAERPRNAAVCVTQGILELLDRRELRAVLAHELAHVYNRDILISSVAGAMATVITYLAHMAMFASLFGGRSDDDRGGNALGGCCSCCSGRSRPG